MRRRMNGLALQVQEALQRDPHAGDLYVFKGARGNLIKILWDDARRDRPDRRPRTPRHLEWPRYARLFGRFV
jgi:hypothetical protein